MGMRFEEIGGMGRDLEDWKDGRVEYWNDGAASFGQINAYGGGLS
jgi:hypothetical protein